MSTKFLLRNIAADNATPFVDDSVSAHTLTNNGNARTVHSQASPFGATTGVAYFDGNGDSAQTAASADFSFGSGNFSIEGWFRVEAFTNAVSRLVVLEGDTGNIDISVYVDNATKKLKAHIGHSGAYKFIITGTTTLSASTWYHFAFVRNGNVHTLYLDAASEGSSTTSHTIPATNLYLILGDALPAGHGYGNTYRLNGELFDVLVANTARTITLPTAPEPRATIDLSFDPKIAISPIATLDLKVINLLFDPKIAISPNDNLEIKIINLLFDPKIAVSPSATLDLKVIDLLFDPKIAISPTATMLIPSYASIGQLSVLSTASGNSSISIGSLSVNSNASGNTSISQTLSVESIASGDSQSNLGKVSISSKASGNSSFSIGSLSILSSASGSGTASLGKFSITSSAGGNGLSSLGKLSVKSTAYPLTTSSASIGRLSVSSTASGYSEAGAGNISVLSSAAGQSLVVLPRLYSISITTIARVAYAMNTATGETTKFTNYDFIDMIRLGHNQYGITSTGLHIIGGTESITASFTTHETNYGNNKLKRIPKVYLDSEDVTTITPIIDGTTESAHTSSFGGHKTNLARGYIGKWYQWKISNVSGAPMRVGAIESLIEETDRRI